MRACRESSLTFSLESVGNSAELSYLCRAEIANRKQFKKKPWWIFLAKTGPAAQGTDELQWDVQRGPATNAP
jgi:hypothetical protein